MNHIYHNHTQIRRADLKPGDTIYYHHPQFGRQKYSVVDRGCICIEIPWTLPGMDLSYVVEPKYFGSTQLCK